MQGGARGMKSDEIVSSTAYGVDGCKVGWIYIALDPSGTILWFVVPTLGELVTMANDADHFRGYPDWPCLWTRGAAVRQESAT